MYCGVHPGVDPGQPAGRIHDTIHLHIRNSVPHDLKRLGRSFALSYLYRIISAKYKPYQERLCQNTAPQRNKKLLVPYETSIEEQPYFYSISTSFRGFFIMSGSANDPSAECHFSAIPPGFRPNLL